MKRIFQIYCLLLTVCASLAGRAEARSANCQLMAVEIKPNGIASTLTTVREWDENKIRYVEQDGKLVPVKGDWKDGANDADTKNHLGCVWLYADLTKGLDYVISVKDGSGCYVAIRKAMNQVFTDFSSVQYDGQTHYYIRSTDWKAVDPDRAVFYVYIYGGRGSVGRDVTVNFQQKSIDKILPQVPGTVKCPIGIDASQSGSTTIAPPPERYANRLATAYSAKLTPGQLYTFSGEAPIPGSMNVYCSAVGWDGIPGVYSFDEKTGNLTVSVTEEYTLVFVTVPDNEHWETGNVGGGTLNWMVGQPEPPDTDSAGYFHGDLLDVERGLKEVHVELIAKRMDDGTGEFSAMIRSGMMDFCELEADGDGMLVGETVVDGKTYKARFSCVFVSDKVVNVDGSIYLKGENCAIEYFYSGDLVGDLVPWEQSFFRVNPDTESAEQMGIKAGGFKDEPAGSRNLILLTQWGTWRNLPIQTAELINFTEKGDPIGLTSEAYLLALDIDKEAVEDAKSDLVIVAFDPETGTVTLKGRLKDGDAHGNGKVEVRTATEPDGDYTKTPKTGDRLFYRAFLVRW